MIDLNFSVYLLLISGMIVLSEPSRCLCGAPV